MFHCAKKPKKCVQSCPQAPLKTTKDGSFEETIYDSQVMKHRHL